MAGHRAAVRYARALLDLAGAAGSAEAVRGDLREIAALAAESPELRVFLAAPAIPAARQQEVAGRVFSGELAPATRQLLELLIRRRRMALLADVCEAYERLYCEKTGILKAEVVSAFPLSPGQREELQGRLRARYGLEVELAQAVDRSLIGGFLVKAAGRVHDLSVRGRLDVIRAAMSEAR